MLFLLATAGADTGLFERKYRLLIRLNVGFVVFLMAVVGYLLWRLRRRLKAGVFGSRLAVRLLLIFSLMAILPGALVYGVSVQFLGKSIESWFDIEMDRALEGGLNLGRGTLDNLLDELQVKARAAEEAMRLVAEKKRGEIKYANASRDIANFVNNADLMEQRKKDYQMSAEFEGASGVTKIQVGRNWSRTIVAGSVVGILLVLILVYALMR